jgi:hypothetical protein
MSDGIISAIRSIYALVFPKRGAYIHDHGQFPNSFLLLVKSTKSIGSLRQWQSRGFR